MYRPEIVGIFEVEDVVHDSDVWVVVRGRNEEFSPGSHGKRCSPGGMYFRLTPRTSDYLANNRLPAERPQYSANGSLFRPVWESWRLSFFGAPRRTFR